MFQENSIETCILSKVKQLGVLITVSYRFPSAKVAAAPEKAEEPGKQMLGPQRAWATAGQEPSWIQVFILRVTSRAGLLLLRA